MINRLGIGVLACAGLVGCETLEEEFAFNLEEVCPVSAQDLTDEQREQLNYTEGQSVSLRRTMQGGFNRLEDFTLVNQNSAIQVQLSGQTPVGVAEVSIYDAENVRLVSLVAGLNAPQYVNPDPPYGVEAGAGSAVITMPRGDELRVSLRTAGACGQVSLSAQSLPCDDQCQLLRDQCVGLEEELASCPGYGSRCDVSNEREIECLFDYAGSIQLPDECFFDPSAYCDAGSITQAGADHCSYERCAASARGEEPDDGCVTRLAERCANE